MLIADKVEVKSKGKYLVLRRPEAYSVSLWYMDEHEKSKLDNNQSALKSVLIITYISTTEIPALKLEAIVVLVNYG